VGLKNWKGKTLGTISKFTLLLPISSIDKFKEKKLVPNHTPMPLSLKPVKMTWSNKHLEHLPIWQQQQLLTVMWLQN
jgi:hypothetical protein